MGGSSDKLLHNTSNSSVFVMIQEPNNNIQKEKILFNSFYENLLNFKDLPIKNNINGCSDKGVNSIPQTNLENPDFKYYTSLENNNLFESLEGKEENISFNYNSENLGRSLDLNEANTEAKTPQKKSIEIKKPEIKEENNNDKEPESNIIIEIKKERKEEENKTKLPEHYKFGKIREYFKKLPKDIYDRIINDFTKSYNFTNLEKKMSDETFNAPKKRNRDKEKKETEPKKLGRKRKEDNSNREHNKDSEDNMIKKMKVYFINSLLIFINLVFNSSLDEEKIKLYVRKTYKNEDKAPEKEDLIKDLNYKKTVNETKKEINLGFLKLKLKDFLSIEISPKFSTYKKNSNEIVINEIINKEQDNRILMFILNDLTFEDYIDIYTYKKDLNSFKQLDENELNFIQSKFIYVDELLKEVHKINNENNYFSRFVSILYNFKRWFFIKQERKRL